MRYPRFLRGCLGFTAFSAALVLGGCAYRVPEVSPADIPRIEKKVAADPGDTDLRVQLGMAQYKAGQYAQARTSLQAAVDSGNQSGAGLLYLGMTQEHFRNWAAARQAYSKYLTVGRSQPLKNEIRKRLQLLAQEVLKQRAKEAVAQENRLSAAPPTPRSLAVLPFAFNSTRTELEPLVYALSDMMTTDFAVSRAVTVLERARIQALLDEMALTQAGYTDPATGARAGRILRAEHIVQGAITTLGEQELRIDDVVLNTARSTSVGSVTAQDALDKLFDMEKELVFKTLRDVLGVRLTPAEEQRIRENRTANVLSFLAYGRGLHARDLGNYEGALQDFRQAHRLDPGFGAAATAVTETTDMTDAASTSPGALGATADATGETGGQGKVAPPTSVTIGTATGSSPTSGTLTGASEGVNPTPTSGTLDLGSTGTGQNQTNTSTPTTRDHPTQNATDSEGTATKVTIHIVIPKPGGGGD